MVVANRFDGALFKAGADLETEATSIMAWPLSRGRSFRSANHLDALLFYQTSRGEEQV
jgi:hypothetical protein